MAWTTPVTVVTGAIIPASWGNTYVRDNDTYLKSVVDGTLAAQIALAALPVEVQRAGDQPRASLAHAATATAVANNNTATPVGQFDITRVLDQMTVINSGFGLGNDRLRVDMAGTYEVGGFVQFEPNATGYRSMEIVKNGVKIGEDARAASPAGATTVCNATTVESFAVNDVVYLTARQTSGGTLSYGGFSGLWAYRIGA